MAPEDRRAALIAATVPLLREHGLAVTTRQIADAAGVAEGTIFGVFPDKASLLRAAVLSALDPEHLLAKLNTIAPGGDLRTRLRGVVELLRQGFIANEQFIAATRSVATDPANPTEFVDRLKRCRQQMVAGVAGVFEPHRALLRGDPDSAARLLFMLVMATVHAGFGAPNALRDLDSDEIVSLLLDGLLVRPEAASTGDPT
jgi:AcrR family transcriptional regulator